MKRFTLRDASAEVCHLLLYLPEQMLVVTADRNTCMIYDLISTKLYRRILLKDILPIKQLSFQNNSLYITQIDSTVYNESMPMEINEIPNCIVSKIDFFKTENLPTLEKKKKIESDAVETNDCSCSIL